jgi:hypothetical protein
MTTILPRYSAWQVFVDTGNWPTGEPPKWACARDGRSSWPTAANAVIDELVTKLQSGLTAQEMSLLRAWNLPNAKKKKNEVQGSAGCVNCISWEFRISKNDVDYGECKNTYGRMRISIANCFIPVRASEEVLAHAEIHTSANYLCSAQKPRP